MLKNYLKIAIRNLFNRKLVTAINIFGLSFGIASAALAFIFIQHEFSFDKFHKESDKIHWFHVNVDNAINLSSTPAPFATDLVNTFPEITEGSRIQTQSIFIQSGQETFKEKVLFVDQNFFSFFNFPLIAGDHKSALSEVNSVVLSQEMARKYFGQKDPIGEILQIIFNEKEVLVKITGVAKNPPTNSSIQFQFLLPIQLSYQDNLAKLDTDWSSFRVSSFIRFREKEDIASFPAKLPEYAKSKYDKIDEEGNSKYSFKMSSLDDYHLNNSLRINGLIPPGEPSYIKILAIISFLILFVACLNFMNLSNAQSSHRLKEVGVRQVLGARRKELMVQFLSESLLISFISLFIAILLLSLFIPFTNYLFEYPLDFDLTKAAILLPLLGITILTGLLAGSYPSFLLSNLSAVKTFKSNLKIGGNNWATKTSLIFQFALSIGLLVCTGIMQQQQQFISQRNLGFNKEEIIVIPTQVEYGDQFDSQRFVKQYSSELNNFDGVKQLAGVSYSFSRGNRAQFITEEDGTMKVVFEYGVDQNYVELLQIEILEGRNFSNDIKEDLERSIIINENFRKEYQVEDIESYKFPESFGENYANKRIIGVAKDYHFNHLRSKIKPMLLSMNSENQFGHMLVKIKPDDVSNTLAHLKSTWQKTRPDKPFEFHFLDEDLQKQYVSETRWTSVLTGASILAIFIAMFGLFGLLALVLAQRSKEIGIRKILGARMNNILFLLSKDFLILIGIALIIASPIAWYFMNQWLENFAFHIQIQWWMFALTGLFIVGIAVLTISFQSIKVALTSPSESLKSE